MLFMSKRKNIILDPVKIDNYNKFLTTLDSLNKKDTKLDEIKKNINDEKNIKKEVDKIIETINNNFNTNNLDSSNFTGQSANDIFMSYLQINDPNKYDDNYDSYKEFHFKNSSVIKKIYKTSPTIKKDNNQIIIKETINIDVEINTITDILKLIETYKCDPTIKYNIDMKTLHNIKEPLEELNNMIGMKDLKNNIVDQILYFIQNLHKNKNSSGDFLHTVIYGPPGTGKTEIAKIMGKIYSKLGILSKGTFKKVTRSDLIAGYLGQTALKTKDVIKESIGGVLFIDEAYALGNPEKRDSFSKECIDTLCEALSDNKENLMVIIAGYEKELKESFFAFNQGLDSRFTWRFKTDEYTHEDLYKIFLKKIKDIGWDIDDNSNITSDWFKKNKSCFRFYGRDIETLLSKTKIAHSRRVFCRPESEKKFLTVKDLDKGFEIYLKNEDIKSKKDEEELKRYIYNTIYS